MLVGAFNQEKALVEGPSFQALLSTSHLLRVLVLVGVAGGGGAHQLGVGAGLGPPEARVGDQDGPQGRGGRGGGRGGGGGCCCSCCWLLLLLLVAEVLISVVGGLPVDAGHVVGDLPVEEVGQPSLDLQENSPLQFILDCVIMLGARLLVEREHPHGSIQTEKRRG